MTGNTHTHTHIYIYIYLLIHEILAHVSSLVRTPDLHSDNSEICAMLSQEVVDRIGTFAFDTFLLLILLLILFLTALHDPPPPILSCAAYE